MWNAQLEKGAPRSQPTTRNCRVLTEAQLGNSDRRHLGQILTYACALWARAMVWLASRFRAKHRSVFDRLNACSPLELSCFAVEMDTRLAVTGLLPPRHRQFHGTDIVTARVAVSALVGSEKR